MNPILEFTDGWWGPDSPFSSSVLSNMTGQYLRSLLAKLQTCSVITDPKNVIVGESEDLYKHFDKDCEPIGFPRLEILITKDKGEGYYSQRNMNYTLRYSIAGYLVRDHLDVDIEDAVSLSAFGSEVRALNYSFLDDKQASNPPCSGFLQMGEFPEIFYEFELFPSEKNAISAFIFHAEAHLEQNDRSL